MTLLSEKVRRNGSVGPAGATGATGVTGATGATGATGSTPSLASASEWHAGTDTTKALGVDNTWDAAAEVTLSDGATIAVDLSTGINFVVTLGGNRTLGNPTNEKVGQSGYIRIVQDTSAPRTLAYGSDWEFAGGVAPVLSTANNDQDILFYVVLAADRVFAALTKDIS